MTFNNILVALDVTEIDQQVVDAAIALATADSANLMLLYVFSPGDPEVPAFPGLERFYSTEYEQAIAQFTQQWQQLQERRVAPLRALEAQIAAQGIAVKSIHRWGYPGPLICLTAREQRADLILLGRHGRTGLQELFLGSVSNDVLHHAPCSVLTIQGKAMPDRQVADFAAPRQFVQPVPLLGR